MKINGYVIIFNSSEINSNPIGIAYLSGYCDTINTWKTILKDVHIHHIYFYNKLSTPYIQKTIITDKLNIVDNTTNHNPVTELPFFILDNRDNYKPWGNINPHNSLFLKLTDALIALKFFTDVEKEHEYIVASKNISLPENIVPHLYTTPIYCEYNYIDTIVHSDKHKHTYTTTGILECLPDKDGYLNKDLHGHIICDTVVPIAYYRDKGKCGTNKYPIILYDNISPYNTERPDKNVKLGRPLRFKFGHWFESKFDTSLYTVKTDSPEVHKWVQELRKHMEQKTLL